MFLSISSCAHLHVDTMTIRGGQERPEENICCMTAQLGSPLKGHQGPKQDRLSWYAYRTGKQGNNRQGTRKESRCFVVLHKHSAQPNAAPGSRQSTQWLFLSFLLLTGLGNKLQLTFQSPLAGTQSPQPPVAKIIWQICKERGLLRPVFQLVPLPCLATFPAFSGECTVSPTSPQLSSSFQLLLELDPTAVTRTAPPQPCQRQGGKGASAKVTLSSPHQIN